MSEANVTPLKQLATIQVDEADAVAVHEAAAAIVLLQQQLGEEEERHIQRQRDLVALLGDARDEYQHLIKGLARRYVKDQGDFRFVPEIGAFVGSGQQGEK